VGVRARRRQRPVGADDGDKTGDEGDGDENEYEDEGEHGGLLRAVVVVRDSPRVRPAGSESRRHND
jgi:hypothetical protein